MSAPFRSLVTLGFTLTVLAGPASGETGMQEPPDSGVRNSRPDFLREEPFMKRPFRPYIGGSWVGMGIAYGPYRDGQKPGGPDPSRAELREDLRLMSKHWNLLRLYGALGPSPVILDVIREDTLDMKIMLGIWIEAEDRKDEHGAIVEHFPAKRAANREEIESAVRLAAEFPEIIVAVCVGNETQVAWSGHRCPPELLVNAIREVRGRVNSPVTVADDFAYWTTIESMEVAREIDFLVTHSHPMWNGIQLEDALDWTERKLGAVRAVHPDQTLVIGETGWATQVHSEGEQARLIRGVPGEQQQAIFFDEVTEWAGRTKTTVFFFEAFDENWKGGEHPDEVEKHWGLFRSDRVPKQALSHER